MVPSLLNCYWRAQSRKVRDLGRVSCCNKLLTFHILKRYCYSWLHLQSTLIGHPHEKVVNFPLKGLAQIFQVYIRWMLTCPYVYTERALGSCCHSFCWHPFSVRDGKIRSPWFHAKMPSSAKSNAFPLDFANSDCISLILPWSHARDLFTATMDRRNDYSFQ